MYLRRFFSVLTAAVSIGVCGYITYISRDVDISSLAINVAFLGIMIVILAAGIFFGLLRLMRISRDLSTATETIRNRTPEQGLMAEGLFQNEFLDGCYAQYCKMVKSNPEGSCDIREYINEDVIDTRIHRGLLELIPDILTSFGILGTFIGLVLGLRSFDPTGYEEMAATVSPLIDGIKVAFVTSIYGLALSMPFSFNLRNELSDLSSSLDSFLDAFYLHVRPSYEVDIAAKLLEQKKSQEDLTNDLTGIFVEQMSKSFEQSITPAFARMADDINYIVDTFTRSQEQAVTQICESVAQEMRSELTSAFDQIGETITQIEKSHTTYTEFMDRTMVQFQETFQTLQNQLTESGQYNTETLERLTQAQQEAGRVNEEQKASYQEYISFMYHSLEKVSTLWEKNNEQLQTYSEELSKIDPGQTNMKLRKDLASLSAQLKEMQAQQLTVGDYKSSEDGTDEQLERILNKLEELEELSSSPVMFRRRKQR